MGDWSLMLHQSITQGGERLWSVTDRMKSLPLPDDPNLAAWASALNNAGHWADISDARFRLVFATDEMRLSLGDTGEVSFLPLGFHIFSAEATRFRVSVPSDTLITRYRPSSVTWP